MSVLLALGNLLRAPTYRWIALLLFFSGVTASIVAPTFALFASTQLQASELQITTFFAANALVGIFVVLVIGRYSDRIGQRRQYIAAGFLWMAAGYAVLSTAHEFFTMALVGMVFFSVLEVGNVQLHALAKEAHDHTAAAKGLESTLTGSLRASYVCGWVLGPLFGGALLALLGHRHIFVLSAVLYVAWAVVSLTLLPRRQAAAAKAASEQRNFRGLLSLDRRPLLIFGVAVAFTLGGDVLRLALLPVLLDRGLGVGPQAANITFSIAPCLQMVFMPLVGYLADRFGTRRIVIVGAVAGALYYGSLVFVTAIWQVYVLQAFYAFLIACIIGVGISHAQKLAHGEAGLATSVYFCAKLVAVVVGSMLSGIVAQRYGVGISFAVPAVMCAIGAVLTLVASRHEARPAANVYAEAGAKS